MKLLKKSIAFYYSILFKSVQYNQFNWLIKLIYFTLKIEGS